MQNQVPGNIENLTGDRPRGLGLSFLLTLRAFGDMGLSGAAGPANRSHLASVLSVPERSIIGCRQTHSRRVAAVDVPGEEAAGSGSVAGCTGGGGGAGGAGGKGTAGAGGLGNTGHIEADGLVTSNPDLLMSVTVADCMPIYLYTSDGRVFGVLHSGRRGTGIAQEAARLVESRYGYSKSELHFVLGPSIGSCCYRVDRATAEGFAGEFGAQTLLWKGEDPYIDLVKANASLLQEAGLSYSIRHECTACTLRYGSNRREGASLYTRMLAVAGRFAGEAGAV